MSFKCYLWPRTRNTSQVSAGFELVKMFSLSISEPSRAPPIERDEIAGEELGRIDASSHGIATAKSQTGNKTSKLERLKRNLKGARIRFLNHIFGIFLVFHQPTSQVVCVIHERQHERFKTRASILVIHGRGLLYDKVYRLLTTFIPGHSQSGIFPGRNRYGPDDGFISARPNLSTKVKN